MTGSLAGWPAGGFVYPTHDGDLVAYDPECRVLWRYAGGVAVRNAAWGPVAVAVDSSVHAARESGEIVALDASGQLRWKHQPDETFGYAIHLLPGTGGSLFAVTQSGEIAAFDSLGERVWSYELPAAGDPGPPQLTPDGSLALTQGGRLWYFSTDPALVAAEPTPAPLPADQKAAQEEIVSFMLDYAGCQVESLFILGPMGENGASVDTDHPLRVWWCSGGKFTEREDMQAAIADAQKQIKEAGTEVRTYPVSTFEFAIDVADDLQNATVYVGWVRGPLWGQGDLYTLKRSPTGEWWIVDQQNLWVS